MNCLDLPYLRRSDIKLIALSGNAESILANSANCFIIICSRRGMSSRVTTASTTLTLAMGDALAVCLLKERL